MDKERLNRKEYEEDSFSKQTLLRLQNIYFGEQKLQEIARIKVSDTTKQKKLRFLITQIDSQLKQIRGKIKHYESIHKIALKLRTVLENQMICGEQIRRGAFFYRNNARKIERVELVKHLQNQIAIELAGLDIDEDQLQRERKKYCGILKSISQVICLRS